ncbi:hypothetical protein AB0950_37115 [Streptomyces sp. NPDC007189]|uniref:hypothetical protein n=1 Tax=Streptomyces sp. NPDC007189 TaxID=3154315 RepID=UPI003452D1E3
MLVIALAVLLVLIAVGVVLIHQLNGQHDERIAAFHYSDVVAGIGRRPRMHPRSAVGRERSDASHRDGDRR